MEEQTTPGLQVERTQLSWERSAFGIVVGGALVLLRPHGPLEVGRIALASLAGLLALAVLWLGYRRSLHMRDVSRTVREPRLEILVLGYGTAMFALAIVVALLVAL